jgi:hypothetical protein
MQAFQEAIDFAFAHKTSWSRDNLDNFGIHKADPAPFNQLLGPVHPRGGVSGVIHVTGEKVCEWGEPHRADLTFSIAKTYLAMLAGVAHDTGLLAEVHEPVHRKVTGVGFEDPHNAQVTWMHLLQQTNPLRPLVKKAMRVLYKHLAAIGNTTMCASTNWR